MKNCINLLIASILLIITCSCHAYKVIDSGYNDEVNISNYKTFSWLPETDTTNSKYDNSEFRNSIITDFTKQLIKQKYTAVTDTPAFYIDLNISYSNQTRYEDYLVPQAPQMQAYSNRVSGGVSNMVAPRDIKPTVSSGNNSLSTTTFNFTTSAPRSYCPNIYDTRAVCYIEDFVTINIIDSKTDEVILSITSEADINLGDGIPDSPNSIAKNLARKFQQLKKESARLSIN
jgi:uncharacterized protein DUF4136